MYKQSRGWQILQLSKEGTTAEPQSNKGDPSVTVAPHASESAKSENAELVGARQSAEAMTNLIPEVPKGVEKAILDMIVEASQIGKGK